MPNPYDEIFEDKNEEEKSPSNSSPFSPQELEEDDRFQSSGKEPLDEILDQIQHFQKEAEPFSQLLTSTSAVDHKVPPKLARFFLVENNPEEKKSLKEERSYHDLLNHKFESIIVPMRALAKVHLDVVQQFNRDIDKDYYSVEKKDIDVKTEITHAINGLNMQRKILADGASDLALLKEALIDTERRIKKYIDAGGMNNILRAEFEIITQKRTTITSGHNHQFDFSFFNINLLDKTVISLGFYMKETSAQYLGTLLKVFEI